MMRHGRSGKGCGSAMILTIWRHGMAEEGAVDRLRNLTPGGRDDVGFGCRQFRAACSELALPVPAAILYSPWLRTAQTAQIIAAAYTHARIAEEPSLQPGSVPAAVDATVCAQAELPIADAHLVLVSHQPLVSQLIDYYLGEERNVPILEPGALATLSLEVPARACGRLLFWAMPPEYEVVV